MRQRSVMSKMRTNTDSQKSNTVSRPSATDKENLVAAGRMLRSTNKQIKEVKTENVTSDKTKLNLSNKSKKKTCEDKAIQTAPEEYNITTEDLTSKAPSKYYWKVLAEKRQKVIDEFLVEISTLKEQNNMLKEQLEKLNEKNILNEEMLQEAKTFIEVVQEMIENNSNDSNDNNGINNSLEDTY
ncbi:PREDICTED: multicilin-like isoform X2 [Dinoponera quadriceps]|uniref:Multicilin-like isoform X2 n=1 Tax=Dinoponera quadriceps TaxID=609295 RepID=A0A6P3XJT7_DINQU|nr:PREDICTED: multicilin-like isoform X2 [Dinoponera quadriceps]